MASRHFSVRLDNEAFERLEAESRRSGRSKSEVAKSVLEEGLRMRQHPGIVFRPGPTGRRPALAGGPDVWEVARVLRGVADREGDVVAETAELTGLHRTQVEVALRYYAEYRDEIDGWIARVDEEALEAETAWLREQALLRR